MEEIRQDLPEDQTPEAEQPVYQPRPRWQVWAARIALVVFLLLLVMYYTNIFRGSH